jgi:hypothetical protein
MLVASAVLFESPEELYRRVFRELRPGLQEPAISVRHYPFTDLKSNIRLRNGLLEVKISDLLRDAPAPIQESLAYILLAKLFRQQPQKGMPERYRLYLGRQDVRSRLEALRAERGRKVLEDAQGTHHDLDAIFWKVNERYFGNMMAKPRIGWSRQRSRSILGHYDSSHYAVAVSRLLDHIAVPEYVVEYVVYHELLHVKHPVEHNAGQRRIHTRAFVAEEKLFDRFREAKEFLKGLHRIR